MASYLRREGYEKKAEEGLASLSHVRAEGGGRLEGQGEQVRQRRGKRGVRQQEGAELHELGEGHGRQLAHGLLQGSVRLLPLRLRLLGRVVVNAPDRGVVPEEGQQLRLQGHDLRHHRGRAEHGGGQRQARVHRGRGGLPGGSGSSGSSPGRLRQLRSQGQQKDVDRVGHSLLLGQLLSRVGQGLHDRVEARVRPAGGGQGVHLGEGQVLRVRGQGGQQTARAEQGHEGGLGGGTGARVSRVEAVQGRGHCRHAGRGL